MLTTGTGQSLTFTNAETGTTLTLRSNVAASKVTTAPDGTVTDVVTGHQVLNPVPHGQPGRSVDDADVGRVVFPADPNGVFTVRSTSGRRTDIFRALS